MKRLSTASALFEARSILAARSTACDYAVAELPCRKGCRHGQNPNFNQIRTRRDAFVCRRLCQARPTPAYSWYMVDATPPNIRSMLSPDGAVT
jgi:hypothetical protein